MDETLLFLPQTKIPTYTIEVSLPTSNLQRSEDMRFWFVKVLSLLLGISSIYGAIQLIQWVDKQWF